MTRNPADVLETLLRDNQLGWMIDMYSPNDRVVQNLVEQLDRVADEFRKRFHYNLSFAPEQLEAEAQRNPHKIRAFLQALAATGKTDMLVMVWRILQGLSIHQVQLAYTEKQSFRLDVTLARPGQGNGPDLEAYSSDAINDAILLRHFGVTTINNRPLFEGFFPVKKP